MKSKKTSGRAGRSRKKKPGGIRGEGRVKRGMEEFQLTYYSVVAESESEVTML